MARLPAEWEEQATHIPVLDLAKRHGADLKRVGDEWIGPCPVCGGRDRFSVNTRKGVFHCRRAGTGGGAVSLYMYLTGKDFRTAILDLTGHDDPDSGIDQSATPGPPSQSLAHLDAQTPPAAPTSRRADNEYREAMRRSAFDLWREAKRDAQEIADYFDKRGCLGVLKGGISRIGRTSPWLSFLRYAPRLRYTEHFNKKWHVIHEGPAMLAAILGADGRFIGVHRTWFDLEKPFAKAEITHPISGERLVTKKVLGSQKGGYIPLHDGSTDAARAAFDQVVVGEGIETVAAFASLNLGGDDLSKVALWSAVSLGNLTGRAAQSVAHPIKTRTDTRGRIRAVKVPGPQPDFTDRDTLFLPDRFRGRVLLGDGDSDAFTTRAAMARAEARHKRDSKGAVISCGVLWARAGEDFADEVAQRWSPDNYLLNAEDPQSSATAGRTA